MSHAAKLTVAEAAAIYNERLAAESLPTVTELASRAGVSRQRLWAKAKQLREKESRQTPEGSDGG